MSPLDSVIFRKVAAFANAITWLGRAATLSSTADRRHAGVLSDADPENAPRMFGYKMSWLAVRTSDTARLLNALGLQNIATAGWSRGVSEIYSEQNGDSAVYVSPPLGEWTLVAGVSLPHPLGPSFVDKCSLLLRRLSSSFGEAQYFFTFPLLDFYAWAKASDGEMLRAFATGDEGIIWNRGALTPEEKRLNLRLFELRGVDAGQTDPGGATTSLPTEAEVLRLAGWWSVDPSQLEQRAGGQASRELGYLCTAPMAWRSERRHRSAA